MVDKLGGGRGGGDGLLKRNLGIIMSWFRALLLQEKFLKCLHFPKAKYCINSLDLDKNIWKPQLAPIGWDK